MIYFIQNLRSGLIKIGFTDGNPRQRLRQLQTGAGSRLVLLGVIPGDRYVEAFWHHRFRKQRVDHEWFQISRRQVEEIIECSDRIESGGPQMMLPFEQAASKPKSEVPDLSFTIYVDPGRKAA